MKRLILFLLILITVAIIASLALAQTGGLQMLRSTIAGGGRAEDDSGRFTANAAIGQSVAGTSKDGGRFVLDSGYFGRGSKEGRSQKIYLPLVLRH